jgi:CubicO group peptidase (beta-lactamase class C family)
VQALLALDGWPVDNAACAVLRPGTVVATAGDLSRRYPWASITKLCTALAVLVAVEDGAVALDAPSGPPGATVAHLLSHASGLPTSGTTPIAPPGRRRIYSNGGYEVLAATLAAMSGMAFDRYLLEAVATPLGMDGVAFGPDASPAAGMVGSMSDLLALGLEMLTPRLLAAVTYVQAISIAFPGLAGVLPGFGRQDPCDWGLGFEVRGGKHPHWTGATNSRATVGHFAQSGGFIWADPVVEVALAVLTDRPFGPWAIDAWPKLADAALAELRVGPPDGDVTPGG